MRLLRFSRNDALTKNPIYEIFAEFSIFDKQEKLGIKNHFQKHFGLHETKTIP